MAAQLRLGQMDEMGGRREKHVKAQPCICNRERNRQRVRWIHCLTASLDCIDSILSPMALWHSLPLVSYRYLSPRPGSLLLNSASSFILVVSTAPPHRLAATPINSRAQRAQPYPAARPPHSQQFVNRHPELCYAPCMMTIPLPEDTQPGWRPSPHTSYASAHAPTRGGTSTNGALHSLTTAREPMQVGVSHSLS